MNTTLELPLQIKSYSNTSVISQYCRQFDTQEDEAKELFEETLLFLWRCANTDKKLLPSKKIDAMWHVFILNTWDYERFCLNNFGKFIHHYPFDEERTKNTANYEADCDSGGDAGCSAEGCNAGVTIGQSLLIEGKTACDYGQKPRMIS